MTPLLICLLTVVISFVFYTKQNKQEKIGGKIALCKLFWLDYTLIVWFFLPIYFYINFFKAGHFYVLYLLSISMWIRGIAELFMLYVTKNWTPPIGITHNIFTFILVSFSWYIANVQGLIPNIFIFSILISLALETYYAFSFYKIVNDQTKGDKAIWFASKENPKFQTILKITVIGNFFVYTGLFIFLLNL